MISRIFARSSRSRESQNFNVESSIIRIYTYFLFCYAYTSLSLFLVESRDTFQRNLLFSRLLKKSSRFSENVTRFVGKNLRGISRRFSSFRTSSKKDSIYNYISLEVAVTLETEFKSIVHSRCVAAIRT